MTKRLAVSRVSVSLIAGAVWAATGCGGGGATGQMAGQRHAADQGAGPPEEVVMPDTSIAAAQAAQEELTPTVMALPGVTGTAVGLCDDKPCIKVYLARDDEELRARIPESHRGFKVDVEVSGEFEARDSSP